jgi:hypothetical protein
MPTVPIAEDDQPMRMLWACPVVPDARSFWGQISIKA